MTARRQEVSSDRPGRGVSVTRRGYVRQCRGCPLWSNRRWCVVVGMRNAEAEVLWKSRTIDRWVLR